MHPRFAACPQEGGDLTLRGSETAALGFGPGAMAGRQTDLRQPGHEALLERVDRCRGLGRQRRRDRLARAPGDSFVLAASPVAHPWVTS